MEITVENVTPNKAEAWLNANKSNRKMRNGVAEKYADDMRNGQWTTCPAPIAFYADGDLADGQHRLWAIVDSGVPVRFPIVRGLKREDGLNIDTGLGRSLVDNARISGADTDLSPALVGVARAVETGVGARGAMSNAQRLALVEAHREAAKWAVSNAPKGKFVGNMVVMAGVARAWYREADKDKLRRFCDVVGSGFADGDTESAAVALRNYLTTKGTVCSSTAMWRDTFLKVQNAISYFMQGKPLKTIRAVAEEAYPLKGKPRRKAGS